SSSRSAASNAACASASKAWSTPCPTRGWCPTAAWWTGSSTSAAARPSASRARYDDRRGGRILPLRRILRELALQRAPMETEHARGFGDVVLAVDQHAVDVLPLHAVE